MSAKNRPFRLECLIFVVFAAQGQTCYATVGRQPSRRIPGLRSLGEGPAAARAPRTTSAPADISGTKRTGPAQGRDVSGAEPECPL